MNECKYIGSRGDRYGSNSIPWISYIFLCKLNSYKLFHNCQRCKKYNNTVIHQYLIKETENTDNEDLIKKNIHHGTGFYPAEYICNQIFIKTNKPFPDAFLNSPMFHELRNIYINKYKLSFTTKSTVIHIRLGDVLFKPNIYHYGNLQKFIGNENLINLINVVYKKFKNPIYLMVDQNKRDIEICYKCLEKSNYKSDNYYKNIIGSSDMDYDIYLMLTARNLITSRSTFSIIPALLNLNTVYTYERWGHYDDIIGKNRESKKFQVLKYITF